MRGERGAGPIQCLDLSAVFANVGSAMLTNYVITKGRGYIHEKEPLEN